MITTQQVLDQERDSLIDALCYGSLELNDEFIDRYAGKRLAAALKAIPERNRAFHLDGHIDEDKAFFNGGIPSLGDDDFLLPCDEIEVQLSDGMTLAEPDEYTINGDLAYLYVGYGLTIPVDVDALERAYRDWIAD